MSRLELNRKLLDILKEKIENNPDLRFIQALWDCKFIDSYETKEGSYEIVDRFNEEPSDTLNRIEKGTPKGDSAKTNSYVPCKYSFIDELFICSCHNTEHQLIISYDKDNKYKELFVSVHLKPLSFWARIKHAFKYIFGHRSRYGDFDEFIFKREDANRLQQVVDYLKSLCI